MSGFIAWLDKVNESDGKARAALRRSLAFDPGQYVPAYPYVEPFVKDDDGWRRVVHYLVAGVWASHWRDGRSGSPMTLAKACASHHILKNKSPSTERRFIALLDADREQLPNRLRQMVALLGEETVDFEALLGDLLRWNDERKRTQNTWARDFYRFVDATSGEEANAMEINA